MTNRRSLYTFTLMFLALPSSSLLTAQTRGSGQAPGYGQVTVGTSLHHDQSQPLRELAPVTTPRHGEPGTFPVPRGSRSSQGTPLQPMPAQPVPDPISSQAGQESVSPQEVNGGTGVATTLGIFNLAGVGEFFNGPNGSFTPPTTPSDATGAVGTTQYFQWVDEAYAIFSKATGQTLVGPMPGNALWAGFGGACEADNDGQPTVNFDKLASRWVVSQYAMSSGAPYLQCVAVSVTDDATGTWNRYSFEISDAEYAWVNRDATLGVWPDAYYMAFDMYAGTTFEGPKFCALQRSNMLAGQSAAIQCIQLGTENVGAIVSDLDSSTPPPTGAPAYFAADDLSSYNLDFWKFHVDWDDSQNTTLSLPILLPQNTFTIDCPRACIEQPNGYLLQPYGSLITGRMPYRNYGDHQSLVAAENINLITGIQFYEIRIASGGDLSIYQQGEFQPDRSNYRFNPSIATDQAGNIAIGYNLSSAQTFPSQYAASRAPGDPAGTLGNETLLNPGNGSQTTAIWDSRSSLTVDPIDDCTYYYTQQYQPMDGTNNWATQIEDFTLAGCGDGTITLLTAPTGLQVSAAGSSQTSPFNGQYKIGSTVAIGTTSPQAGQAGVRYVFKSWSGGGTLTHNIIVPAKGATYTASFNTQYLLDTSVFPAGSGKVTPGSGNFFNSGTVVKLVATPANGYAFTSWTGNVTNPISAATTTTMIEPEEVTANFTPLPTTVTAALANKSGASNDRVWSFTFTNAGPGQANNIQINSFALTQTAGPACTPVLISTLPVSVGNVAPGKAINGKVSIDFSSCGSAASFSLAMGSAENNGASSATLNLTGLAE
jgi:hypothetical protein